MHVILAAEDSEAELQLELQASFAGAVARRLPAGLIEIDIDLAQGERLPYLAFARQLLPNAKLLRVETIRAWAQETYSALLAHLPEGGPWSLHIAPYYGLRAGHHMGARAWHSFRLLREKGGRRPQVQNLKSRFQSHGSRVSDPKSRDLSRERLEPLPVDAVAGKHRCGLIREAVLELLRQKRRHLLRDLVCDATPFAADQSLVQLLLTAPDSGFVSVAIAPLPFEQRHLISAFPKGEVPIARDKAAPSRAFAKLLEAEARLGCAINAGETCADLGAAPGSWTYVAANRGAQVIAVDRSPLREDLMSNPRLCFVSGDAFQFTPPQPFDWLLCDLIAPADRTSELLLRWLRNGWCRRFVVTLKLKDTMNSGQAERKMRGVNDLPALETLEVLKRELPTLSSDLYLTRLSANKKEVCAFGTAHGQ
ncbi:MAG TPA: SAM-dependent methyltransferase [Verrucomicrobiae bacterium]